MKTRLQGLRVLLGPLAEDNGSGRTSLTALAGNVPAKWDIKAAQAAATAGAGEPAVETGLATLRTLAQLSPPPAAEVDKAVSALRAAGTALGAVAGSSASQARDLASLLDAALAHHEAHGDGACTVCGNRGQLTAQWRAAAGGAAADRLRAQATTANEAFAGAKNAAVQALSLITPVPPILIPNGGGLDPVGKAPALTAWRRWSAPVTGDDPVTVEVPGHPRSPGLSRSAHGKHLPRSRPRGQQPEQGGRTGEVDRRDGNWTPVAAEVAAWCARMRRTPWPGTKRVPAL